MEFGIEIRYYRYVMLRLTSTDSNRSGSSCPKISFWWINLLFAVLTSASEGINVLYLPDGGVVAVCDEWLHGIEKTVHVDDRPLQRGVHLPSLLRHSVSETLLVYSERSSGGSLQDSNVGIWLTNGDLWKLPWSCMRDSSSRRRRRRSSSWTTTDVFGPLLREKRKATV